MNAISPAYAISPAWAAKETTPRRFFLRPYPKTIQCRQGHKFDPASRVRHTNCSDCWDAYFTQYPGQVLAAVSALRVYGPETLKRSHGKKYTKQVTRFIEERNIS